MVSGKRERFEKLNPWRVRRREVQRPFHPALVMDRKGARARRPFPSREILSFEPFALFEEFFMELPGEFQEHPHRGVEMVTLVLQGHYRHLDGLGHDLALGEGWVDHVVAGRGMKHREMPARYGLTRGLQLWVGLPPGVRETEPHCRQIPPEAIPEEQGPGFVRRRIAGKKGALSLHLPVEWEEVRMEPRALLECRVPPGGRGFIYFLDGLAYREPEDEDEGRTSLKPGMFWPLEGGEGLLLRGDRTEQSRFTFIRFSPAGA